MAGTILLANEVGVAMNTLAFDQIAESIRAEIPAQKWAGMADVYRAYDHEGMMYLDLTDATAECFADFYAAAVTAMKNAEARNANFPMLVWQELLGKLEEDSRRVA